jgi:hypothetical protein
MSVVTNIILAFPTERFCLPEKRLAAVNRFFVGMKGFVSMDDVGLPDCWYGGAKRLEANLYLGAFNYLDLRSLIEWIRTIPWMYPEQVQLIVKEEDDEVFRIINPCREARDV